MACRGCGRRRPAACRHLPPGRSPRAGRRVPPSPFCRRCRPAGRRMPPSPGWSPRAARRRSAVRPAPVPPFAARRLVAACRRRRAGRRVPAVCLPVAACRPAARRPAACRPAARPRAPPPSRRRRVSPGRVPPSPGRVPPRPPRARRPPPTPPDGTSGHLTAEPVPGRVARPVAGPVATWDVPGSTNVQVDRQSVGLETPEVPGSRPVPDEAARLGQVD